MREWDAAIRDRLSGLGLPPDDEASIIEEVSQHLDDEAAALRARGCSEAHVRERVLAPLNDAAWLSHLRARAAQSRRRAAPTEPARRTRGLTGDIRYALRALGRTPGFTAVAVLSLALGIGGTTAIFSLLHTVLFERLAIPNADELVALRPTRTDPNAAPTRARVAPTAGGGARIPLGISAFRALATTTRIEAFATTPVAVRVGSEADYPYADFVSGGFFDLLGVQPARGRWITADDDATHAPVAVISHPYWRRLFAEDDNIIGRVVDVGAQRVTIVGVAPPSYRGLYFAREFTIALPLTFAGLSGGPRGGDTPVTLVTRRSPSMSIETVAARLDAVYQQCCATGWRLVGDDASRGLPFAFDPRLEYGRILKLLMAGVTILLVVACANVAALLLSRALARRREIAIRMSLGAGRSQVIRLLLVESALLACAGTALGLALARVGTTVLAHNLPGTIAPLGDLIALRATTGVLAFTVVVSVACTMLFGTLPALRAARTDVRESLGGEKTARRSRGWSVDRALVGIQIGLALTLLSSAGLMVATLRNLQRGASAYADSRILFADIDTRGTSYQKTGIQPLRDDILNRVRAVPDVRGVALAYTTPVFGRARFGWGFTIEGVNEAVGADVNFVTSEFFAVTTLPIVRGRAAPEHEANTVVVSESFATRFFAGREAIGREIVRSENGQRLRIVGIAADARYMDLREVPRPTVYLPLSAWQSGAANLVVRTDVDPRMATHAVREAILRAAPGIRVRRIQSADDALAEVLPRERLAASLASVFGIVALTLAAIGLYGVIAYDVTRRSKEIGIRTALGATAGDAVGLVLRQTAAICGIGLILGVLPSVALGRAFGAHLYGIEPVDPSIAAAAMGALALGALAASLIPCIRAARVDPLEAIRME